MVLCAWYWRLSAVMAGTGVGLTATHFDVQDPWLMVGVALVVMGATLVNTGYISMRTRTLDEEFDAGYRVGYRNGRRTAKPVIVSLDSGRKHGRIPEAAVGALASHGAAAGRAEAHTH